MEGFTKWLERLNERMAIKSGIFVCKRIIAISAHLHHVEIMQMHDLAQTLLPKLEQELEDLR
jgi:hypothetical protein